MFKKKNYILTFLPASILCFSLIGCTNNNTPGTDNPPETNNTSIKGTVIDGYLTNATVCLDLNDNYACDSDEPSTKSDSSGKYDLTIAQQSDSNDHAVLVEVTTASTDLDTGETITKPFTLSSPPGKFSVISPITTMIHSTVKNQNATIEQASEIIASRVVGSDNASGFDPFADYVDKKKTDDSYKAVHEVAKVVAKTIGANAEKLKSILPNATAEQLQQIKTFVNDTVLDVLTKLATATRNANGGLAANVTINENLTGTTTAADLTTKLETVKNKQQKLAATGNLEANTFIDQKNTLYRLASKDINGQSQHLVIAKYFLSKQNDKVELYYTTCDVGTSNFTSNADTVQDCLLAPSSNSILTFSLNTQNELSGKFRNGSEYTLKNFSTTSLDGITLPFSEIGREEINKVNILEDKKDTKITFSKEDKQYSLNLHQSASQIPKDISYATTCKNENDCVETNLSGGTIKGFTSSLTTKKVTNCNDGQNCKNLYWFSDNNQSISYCERETDTTCKAGTESKVKSYYESDNLTYLKMFTIAGYLSKGLYGIDVHYQSTKVSSGIEKADPEFLLEPQMNKNLFYNESALRKLLKALEQ